MRKSCSVSRSIFALTVGRLLGILAVLGLVPPPSASASMRSGEVQRVEDIRLRLLEADAAASKDLGAAEDQPATDEPTGPVAGWYNFPNWPNWGNWGNWGNGWRNW